MGFYISVGAEFVEGDVSEWEVTLVLWFILEESTRKNFFVSSGLIFLGNWGIFERNFDSPLKFLVGLNRGGR